LKFSECVINLITDCSPPGVYSNEKVKPSLKQAWKWIRKVLSDYMLLKKEIEKMYKGDKENIKL